jgi:RNA polymerase sigma-70 factor (ECF subfamily)
MMVQVDVEAEYRAHVADLLHYATVLVGPNDAMDVVNEAVTATIARHSLVAVDDVRAYWFRAVSLTAAGWHRAEYRRRNREVRAASLAVSPGTTERGEDGRRLLTGLSVQQRSVIYMTYWLDWDPARIAAALDVSDGTVRKQLARGREVLRKVLRDD